MSQIIPVSSVSENYIDSYDQQISPEYQFERPAIDRLLDYIWTEEARKPAIDKLIEEYFQRLGLPVIHRSTTVPSIVSSSSPSSTENEHFLPTSQTPQRTLQHYPSAPSFYHTPMSSIPDTTTTHEDLPNGNASTPLLQPLSTRSYRSASTTTDRRVHYPNHSFRRISFSSNQDFPNHDRFLNGNKDMRLKRAAANERRQATRHFGKVQPGLIWTSPLPVRARTFSLRPAALSCKIFLGGIPHDLHPRDLQERLESFGSVRLEWPNVDNVHRNASNMMAGFVYAVYENEESVRQILHTCSTKTDRVLDDGRCEYYLDVFSSRMHSRRKSIQIIPWFVEDSQWLMDGEMNNVEQRLNSTESIHRTVFVGALHGMMTAYALAKICQELFGDVEFAAIDTDRNRYPIGSGRVTFVNTHSYYAAVTANYLLIECDKFCKVIQIDPYLSDSVMCAGANGQWCSNMGQYFCRSLKCMKYYCAQCWDLNPHHQTTNNDSSNDHEPPAMIHKPLMRNARTP